MVWGYNFAVTRRSVCFDEIVWAWWGSKNNALCSLSLYIYSFDIHMVFVFVCVLFFFEASIHFWSCIETWSWTIFHYSLSHV